MRRGAVIYVQSYGFRSGEIFRKVIEKLHVRAAPGIYGLVGIAHDEQVFMFAG